MIARVRSLFLLLLAPASSLMAQDSELPWRLSRFPWVSLSPGDGPMLHYRVIAFQQAEDSSRVSLRASWSADAAYSTRGSAALGLRGELPRLAQGWRITTTGEWEHRPHFAGEQRDQQLDRGQLGVDLSRSLNRHLWLSLRGQYQHFSLNLGCYAARFDLYYLTLPACRERGDGEGWAEIRENDLQGRVALVLDLRDREYLPRQGTLLQAGWYRGSAGEGYSGIYSLAEGWISPSAGLRLSARAGLRDFKGPRPAERPAVGYRYQLPAWETPLPLLGGETQRGLAMGERVSDKMQLASVEAEQEVFSRMGGLGRLSLLAFVNGVRSGQQGQYAWSWSGGGGLRLGLMRATSLTLTAASHPGGGVTWYLSGSGR